MARYTDGPVHSWPGTLAGAGHVGGVEDVSPGVLLQALCHICDDSGFWRVWIIA